jgi:hypothetical protein
MSAVVKDSSVRADTSVWFNCTTVQLYKLFKRTNSETQSPSMLETVHRLKLKKKTFRKPKLLPSSSKETQPSHRNNTTASVTVYLEFNSYINILAPELFF